MNSESRQVFSCYIIMLYQGTDDVITVFACVKSIQFLWESHIYSRIVYLLPFCLCSCTQSQGDSESTKKKREKMLQNGKTHRKQKQIRYFKTNHKMNIVADAYHVLLLFAFVGTKVAEAQIVLSLTQQHYDVLQKTRNGNDTFWLVTCDTTSAS